MSDLNARLSLFFASYKEGLERLDPALAAQHCGYPCFLLTDGFAGAVHSADDLQRGFEKMYEIYRRFQFATVRGKIRRHTAVTHKIVRVRMRWDFHDASGAFVRDSEYEYTLRDDDGALRIYVIVSLSGI